MTTRYLRVHVGEHSEIIAQLRGETFGDVFDRGVCIVLDTFDIRIDDATEVWSEVVNVHEHAAQTKGEW